MAHQFRRRILLVGAVLVFVTACASASDSTPAPPVDAAGDPGRASSPTQPPLTEPPLTEPPLTEPPLTEPPLTEPPETEPPETEPPETEPPVTTTPGRDCPVGTWRISTDALQAFYDTVNSVAGTDLTFAGRVIFTLGADRSFTYSMPDFVVTQSIDEVPTSVTLLGDITGTYRVVDGKFVTTIVSSDVEAIGSGADASYSASFLQSFLSDFPVNNATFTCDGEDLVVDFPVVGTTASVRMVPA